MSYKHKAGQSHQLRLSEQNCLTKKSGGQKLATALLAALPMFAVIGATAGLSGCGF